MGLKSDPGDPAWDEPTAGSGGEDDDDDDDDADADADDEEAEEADENDDDDEASLATAPLPPPLSELRLSRRPASAPPEAPEVGPADAMSWACLRWRSDAHPFWNGSPPPPPRVLLAVYAGEEEGEEEVTLPASLALSPEDTAGEWMSIADIHSCSEDVTEGRGGAPDICDDARARARARLCLSVCARVVRT
jgi:hypothetical protein